MADDLDLSPNELTASLPTDRVSGCIRVARRAQRLAVAAGPARRHYYLAIADEWLKAAADILKEVDDEPSHIPTTLT